MYKILKWIYKLGYEKGYKDGESCGIAEYKLSKKIEAFEKKFENYNLPTNINPL